jgi:lysophospholipase
MAYLLALSLSTGEVLPAVTHGGRRPGDQADLLKEFRNTIERGMIIVNCTQCLRGSVTTSYTTGMVDQKTMYV